TVHRTFTVNLTLHCDEILLAGLPPASRPQPPGRIWISECARVRRTAVLRADAVESRCGNRRRNHRQLALVLRSALQSAAASRAWTMRRSGWRMADDYPREPLRKSNPGAPRRQIGDVVGPFLLRAALLAACGWSLALVRTGVAREPTFIHAEAAVIDADEARIADGGQRLRLRRPGLGRLPARPDQLVAQKMAPIQVLHTWP